MPSLPGWRVPPAKALAEEKRRLEKLLREAGFSRAEAKKRIAEAFRGRA